MVKVRLIDQAATPLPHLYSYHLSEDAFHDIYRAHSSPAFTNWATSLCETCIHDSTRASILSRLELLPVARFSWQEREDDAVSIILEWAVAHFDAVASQIDTWLGGLYSAPQLVRQLGEEQLLYLREQLRVLMLRERHGL